MSQQDVRDFFGVVEGTAGYDEYSTVRFTNAISSACIAL